MTRSLDEVYVATDSMEIRDVVESYGGDVIMTSDRHKTGTDRVAEAAADIDCDVVVNIQGDEPLVDPAHIEAILKPVLEEPDVKVAFGVTPYTKHGSTSDIKAVLDLDGNIMYCSRADIPSDARTPVFEFFKMCFIVPFKKDFLMQYASWKPTPLETIEYNEYLRILEHGYRMRAVLIHDAKISVDTTDDLKEVREMMEKDTLRFVYMTRKKDWNRSKLIT
jgi:3-deoxy-manno-octulosonate cytidylyltransferase (CMP-KDO synthetase)